jgi:hypothetical protein
MLDNVKDAPWIGKHKEDCNRHCVGSCRECGFDVFSDEVYFEIDGEIVCEYCES